MRAAQRLWVAQAIERIEADFQRSADTHLIPLPLPGFPSIDLYFKDESTHPSGSLKHRLARSLLLFGLCNGDIHADTTLVEASSGNTAVSEAYFARLLGLPFVAVMPRTTSPEKVRAIHFYGGSCHFVESPAQVYADATRIASERKGHYLDQFSNAERVTDWRSNNNIAEAIFQQMQREPHPLPRWLVCSAGTGGTSATLGRYLRYRRHDTELCVADPEHSVFYACWQQQRRTLTCTEPSRIEGIGRPRCEPSFMPQLIDHMVKVPDAASVAAVRELERLLDRRVGGSTGTQFIAALELMQQMRARGETGSVVTLICDSGERYAHTLFNDDWVHQQAFDLPHWCQRIGQLLAGDAAPLLAPRGD
ncbi:PLP-dependent cysteine synthase family protein [Permianibacter sp. IMCC34836]|uniref:PLP-dependent cysteine synthase family protein n=1 Tax=Permianibacter fluminis TaxID=2738515 RepID=UPI0015524DF3|nr:PLP-dependent cysteine synthase family protein [Permianibacter fluminis]NQD37238.1 PLP-dependent cysteine synthase family protein [Permianibacter fluminis]